MKNVSIVALPFVAFFILACGPTLEESQQAYDDATTDARICDEDDQCVMPQRSPDCICPQPVHQDQVEKANDLADEIPCPAGVMVECAAFAELVCEENTCVGK
jgi:hypothetical protein